jgi:hypothetical protein
MPLIWNDAIFDRTQEDVDRVKYLTKRYLSGDITDEEVIEYAQDLKGALNKSDLERILNNIALLDEVLETHLVIPTIPENVPPDVNFFLQLRTCVQTIRSSYTIHSDTPTTPIQPLNTYGKWNDIERILFDVYDILMSQFFYYSEDQIYCGDNVGLVL